jgi:aryl-alcohol dehydrogenase-like predicted oxidoreductase
MPRFQPGNLQRNLELVANIKAFGAARGMTPAQVALAWLVSRGTDVVPLVGTRRRQHLMEAVRGFEVTLSPQDIRELEALAPAAAVAGSRYPEPLMAQLNK